MGPNLDVAGVMRAALRIYRAQAAVLLPAALLLFVPVAVADAAGRARGDEADVGLLAVYLVVAAGAGYLFQGMAAEAVREIEGGRQQLGLGQLLASIRPVIVPLIVVGVLASLGIVLGLVLLVVPGLVLATRWALLAPVVVVERSGVPAAFRRSRDLVRGNGWRVFGIVFAYIVVQVLIEVASVAVSASAVAGSLAALLGSVLVEPLYAVALATTFFRLKHARDPLEASPGVASSP
jgi:hypothetical protein